MKLTENADMKARIKAMEKSAAELIVAQKTITSLQQEIGDLKLPLNQLATKLEALESEKRESERKAKTVDKIKTASCCKKVLTITSFKELDRLSRENQELRTQCGNFSNIIQELNAALEESNAMFYSRYSHLVVNSFINISERQEVQTLDTELDVSRKHQQTLLMVSFLMKIGVYVSLWVYHLRSWVITSNS